jgi:hypothetical protein
MSPPSISIRTDPSRMSATSRCSGVHDTEPSDAVKRVSPAPLAMHELVHLASGHVGVGLPVAGRCLRYEHTRMHPGITLFRVVTPRTTSRAGGQGFCQLHTCRSEAVVPNRVGHFWPPSNPTRPDGFAGLPLPRPCPRRHARSHVFLGHAGEHKLEGESAPLRIGTGIPSEAYAACGARSI